MRTEKDALGERTLPGDTLTGIHTLRGMENFPLRNGKPFPELVHALFQVKLACLLTNHQLGFLADPVAAACRTAIDAGLAGELDTEFPVTMYQGGAGTTLNMNTNEVIANRALQEMGHQPGNYQHVHPLLHVNLHQSTNDVLPTAGKVAAIALSKRLERAILRLQENLQEQEQKLDGLVKPGRTQMQDAVPVTLGREFSAYAGAIARDRWRVYKMVERLREVNLGGTAVGTGMLAPRAYIFKVVDELKKITGFPLARAENLVDATQNTDLFVEAHGFLSALASTVTKLAGDLRFLSSGPEAGIGEIRLPAVQAGSSIMPGKINPVVPEFAISCCLRVQSNQQLVASASAMGSLELNPFVPVIIHGLLESMVILEACIMGLAGCVAGISVNPETFDGYRHSDVLVTYALAGKLGYEAAQRTYLAAVEAGCTVRDHVLTQGIVTGDELDQLLSPEHLLKLGF